MSIHSISNLISPWCEINAGDRWVIRTDHKITVKSKNDIGNDESCVLAKSYELMRRQLENKKISKEYSSEDFRQLKILRRIVCEKYDHYCKSRCILWRILEVFLGIFRGYSYKLSCRKLINVIDQHINAASQISKKVHPQFKEWWDNEGIATEIKPGIVFLSARVIIEGDKGVAKEITRTLQLDDDSYLVQYCNMLNAVTKEINHLTVSNGKKRIYNLDAEHISFYKEEDKLGVKICKSYRYPRKNLGDPTLIYGWTKAKAKLIDLPRDLLI